MKTIFKFLFVINFLSFFAQNAKTADTLNPCWRMLYPHDPFHESYNPDSVMIDTCATINPEEPVLYAYQWYHVILPPGALFIPRAKEDTLIYRNWRDIDSSFIELRDGFEMIENKFSPFLLKKIFPNTIDSSSLASRTFDIKFEKYFNIDSVEYYLKLINDLFDVYYDMRAGDKQHPCWRMYYPHDPAHGSFNPDSVMLDTCATIDPDPDFPVLYAYKWYYVILPIGALNVPPAPRDSLIYRNWRDIDSSFNELRNGFQLVENKFSPFIMKKEHPDGVDTSSLGSRSWLIKFEEYFNIDTVVYYLELIKDLYDAFYDMRASQWAGDVDDKLLVENNRTIKIFPNPNIGMITIDINNIKYGLQLIEIYNEINNKVYQYSFINFNENIIINLDLSFLPNGIYFLKNGLTIKKFIIFK